MLGRCNKFIVFPQVTGRIPTVNLTIWDWFYEMLLHLENISTFTIGHVHIHYVVLNLGSKFMLIEVKHVETFFAEVWQTHLNFWMPFGLVEEKEKSLSIEVGGGEKPAVSWSRLDQQPWHHLWVRERARHTYILLYSHDARVWVGNCIRDGERISSRSKRKKTGGAREEIMPSSQIQMAFAAELDEKPLKPVLWPVDINDDKFSWGKFSKSDRSSCNRYVINEQQCFQKKKFAFHSLSMGFK